MKIALGLGADFVATGHYCRKGIVEKDGEEIYQLLSGKDPNKDQSYFLCQLSQEQLSKTLFPIGELLKPEVRKIASEQNLITAEKRDSQGLCFIGKVRLPEFLQQKLAPKDGIIVEVPSDLEEYKLKTPNFTSEEEELQHLGTAAHVYIGTGVGNIPTISRISMELYRAQRAWDRFWGDPGRNKALQNYMSMTAEERPGDVDVPPHPEEVPAAKRDQAEEAWYKYWTGQSPELQEYLTTLAEIEGMNVEGTVEAGKMKLIKDKQRSKQRLQAHWGAPEPPWECVSPDLIWNIQQF